MTDRVEKCRACKWWDVEEDGRGDDAIDRALCRAQGPWPASYLYRKIEGKDVDEDNLEWGYSAPDDGCPKFERIGPAGRIRPDVCSGCAVAESVLDGVRQNLDWERCRLVDTKNPGWEEREKALDAAIDRLKDHIAWAHGRERSKGEA